MANIELIQRDDQPGSVSVEQPMNITDLFVRQSPSRNRTVTQPQRRDSGYEERGEERRSFHTIQRVERDDTPPREERRDRRSSDGRRSDRDYYSDRDRRSSGRRESSRMPDLDLEDIGGEKDEIVGLDLLANPRKVKKTDDVPPPQEEEDFDDPSEHDNYVRADERAAFESRGGSQGRDRRSDSSSRSRRRSERYRDRDYDRRYSEREKSYSSHRYYSDKDRDRDYDRDRDRDYYGSGGYRGMSYEEQQRRRQQVLERFDKLMRRGIRVDKRFLDPNLPVEDQEQEATRLEKNIDVQQSIQFQRKMLMAAVTGVEFLNNRYDPLGLQLDGWSESVMEDINNYDPVFEELYDKYHTQVAMAPEFKLMVMLGGSAFMYHITNTMFKSSMPGMNVNPDLTKNMRKSAMGAMGNFMGGSGGLGGFGGGGGGGMASPPDVIYAQPPPGAGPSMSRGVPPAPVGRGGPASGFFSGPTTNTNDLLNGLMDQDPQNINDRIVGEIDDILNNPSDSEGEGGSLPSGRGGDGITLEL